MREQIKWHDVEKEFPPRGLPVWVCDRYTESVFCAKFDDRNVYSDWTRWNNGVIEEYVGPIDCWAYFPARDAAGWIPESAAKPAGLEISEALVLMKDGNYQVLSFHDGEWRMEYLDGCAEVIPGDEVAAWRRHPAKPEGWR